MHYQKTASAELCAGRNYSLVRAVSRAWGYLAAAAANKHSPGNSNLQCDLTCCCLEHGFPTATVRLLGEACVQQAILPWLSVPLMAARRPVSQHVW